MTRKSIKPADENKVATNDKTVTVELTQGQMSAINTFCHTALLQFGGQKPEGFFVAKHAVEIMELLEASEQRLKADG